MKLKTHTHTHRQQIYIWDENRIHTHTYTWNIALDWVGDAKKDNNRDSKFPKQHYRLEHNHEKTKQTNTRINTKSKTKDKAKQEQWFLKLIESIWSKINENKKNENYKIKMEHEFYKGSHIKPPLGGWCLTGISDDNYLCVSHSLHVNV